MRSNGGAIAALFLAFLAGPVAVQAQRVVHVGCVVDGPWEGNDAVLAAIRAEIGALAGKEYDVRFPDAALLVADWSLDGVSAALDRLVRDSEIDFVLALGVLAADRACRLPTLPKPIVAVGVIDAAVQDLPRRDGTSGVHNLSYITVLAAVQRDLRTFHDMVPFRHLAIVANEFVTAPLPGLAGRLRTLGAGLGVESQLVLAGRSAASIFAQLPDSTDAVYLMPLLQLSGAAFDSVVAGLIERRLPSFSALGEKEVERGVLAGTSPDIFPQLARRLAVTVQRILAGAEPGAIPTGMTVGEHLMINAHTASAIGWFPSWSGLSEAEMIEEAESRGRSLTLVGAMQEALVANLDLAAAVHDTRAGSADVALARAALLPQADTSLLGLQIDADRAAASFGTQAERSLTGTLDAGQVLFSEETLARWSIERSLQRGRERDLEQTRLDIARAAGGAYLDVLRARTLERIAKENLQLTRSHLETARLLAAVGTTSLSDVYRWESEIATNRKDAIDANAARNVTEIELNRILNRPAEEAFVPAETDLQNPDVAPSLEPALPFFVDKSSFRVLRDFLASEGLAASPELQQLDAAIAAGRRQLESATRSFYLPNLSLQGSWSGVWAKDGAGSTPLFALPGVPERNDTDWSVGLLASYPLLRGGGRLAVRARAREELGSLEAQRQAAAERIEQRIRTAVHRAGASHAGLREARTAAEWARKNLDLVTDAYARGAASFIALLDAQNAHVVAERSAANAVYNFLDDWLEVQRSIGQFDFTRSDAERESLRTRLQAFAAAARASGR